LLISVLRDAWRKSSVARDFFQKPRWAGDFFQSLVKSSKAYTARLFQEMQQKRSSNDSCLRLPSKAKRPIKFSKKAGKGLRQGCTSLGAAHPGLKKAFSRPAEASNPYPASVSSYLF
jgi:hypothetical protein